MIATRVIGLLRKDCMSGTGKPNPFRIGFLTALEVPEQGFVGGLLVTNRHGRPLEFQCTAPVKPNRTQELLYGPTLSGFLLGELIARTLLEKVGVKPHLILTEREEILELREHVSIPVACLGRDAVAAASSSGSAAESAAAVALDSGETIRLGRQMLRLHAAHLDDREEIQKECHQVPQDADLREPFDRVRGALLEPVRSGAVK